MFPPKTIGIIGNMGKMAGLLGKFFVQEGYQVVGSDIKEPSGLSNEEIVAEADLVFFSISPIANVAPIIDSLVPHARPNTLWVHGTSVQEPSHGPISPVFYDGRLRAAGVDTGYLHLMVGPTIRSLRGQTIVYNLEEPLTETGWETWLKSLFEIQNGALMIKLRPHDHDQLTTGAQLIHMLQGLLCLSLWRRLELNVDEIIEVAGPPGWLHAYSVIRSSGQPDITSNILVNHPNTERLIRTAREVLDDLAKAVDSGDISAVAKLVEEGREAIPEGIRQPISSRVDFHIRLEGDLRGNSLRIEFPAHLNKVGLLAKVLDCFDREGLDKTSCEAQELPGGDCVFYIGLKIPLEDEHAQRACQAVKSLDGTIQMITRR